MNTYKITIKKGNQTYRLDVEMSESELMDYAIDLSNKAGFEIVETIETH